MAVGNVCSCGIPIGPYCWKRDSNDLVEKWFGELFQHNYADSRSPEEWHLADDHLVECDAKGPNIAGKRYSRHPILSEEFRGVKSRSSPHPLSAFLSPVPTAISIPPSIARRLYAGPAAADVPISAHILGVQDHARAEVRNFHLRNREGGGRSQGTNDIKRVSYICMV